MSRVEGTISIEDAEIMFRNFSGAEGQYNAKGRRNFCVLLDPPLADALTNDGWNVKVLKSRDEDEEERPYLQVAVSYDNIPPRIMMITKNGKTTMTEETVGMLDWAEIKSVDLIIRPYNWEVSGKTGVKAYVKTMYIVIEEDEFAEKYYSLPDEDDFV